MSNFIILLKHADTQIDINTPVEEWELSEKGHKRAVKLMQETFIDEIDVLYSSPEKKALDTIAYLERRIGKKAIVFDELRELQRRGEYLKSKGEYNRKVKMILNHELVDDWENPLNALTRMKVAMDKIINENKDKVIAIVSHGIVISLYVAEYFKWKPKEAFSKWKKLTFCDWVIIQE